MGCCSSTARINNPERATEAILATRDIFALQGKTHNFFLI